MTKDEARERAREAVGRAWVAHLEATHPGTRWTLLGEGEIPPGEAIGVVEFPTPDGGGLRAVARDEDRIEGFGE